MSFKPFQVVVAVFAPARWSLCTDGLLILTAVALPWSTTAVGVLAPLWLLALVPLLPAADFRLILGMLRKPALFLPVVLFALAATGMLWSDASWQERFHALAPVVKLVFVPFLICYFQQTDRGEWVFVGFLASCALLMGLSWIVMVAPDLKPSATAGFRVPVKNYIDQSQEFSLCLIALLPVILQFWRERRTWMAAACALLALGFFANMAFVISARTALLYLPVLLAVFAVLYLERRLSISLVIVGIGIGAAVWFGSPELRHRITAVGVEYHEYELNIPASTGRRLTYWQKSLKFFSEAPIVGNGTGSIQTLFEREAVGKTGLAAEVTRNPHNQTLGVAVQWGLLGIIVLYAMWLSHLLLFRGSGLVAWIGLVVVVQNILSSMLNSHLFDFVEGWIYVLGVGVAGGTIWRERRSAAGRLEVGLGSPEATVERGHHDTAETEWSKREGKPA